MDPECCEFWPHCGHPWPNAAPLKQVSTPIIGAVFKIEFTPVLSFPEQARESLTLQALSPMDGVSYHFKGGSAILTRAAQWFIIAAASQRASNLWSDAQSERRSQLNRNPPGEPG
jgi:hypothetical protein